ncbi:Hydrolase [Marinobacter nitratireducens]|uniref:Hydrolase n=1 Tax=Marinobacter nitratireducens TaxID=1137280 RepID=A0A072N7D5_9GAMM|nr:alpha/beta hydrolase [Marinobacter nitratireducens]KEF33137.1 Hydrolase [Marinobacter nitratireducens]
MPNVLSKHHVLIRGAGAHTLVFAHGFGCDHMVWSEVAPAFEKDYRVVTFDHVGCGLSKRGSFRDERHSSLKGYALDLLDIVDDISEEPVTVVGHSVSGMIGCLAASMLPNRFRQVITINPSPRYLNDDDGYTGGFEKADVMAMLDQIEHDQEGWARSLAPLVMENEDRPELTDRLIRSFMAVDSMLLRRFAEATFLCDYRNELSKIPVPVDILYGRSDRVVPVSVVDYMAERIPDVHCIPLEAKGHYPQLSAPEELIFKIRESLGRLEAR